MSTMRFYSTNNNINNHIQEGLELLNSHKINASKTIYLLKPIEASDAFCHELVKVFLSLEPNNKYKLDYCMSLFTNKNKQFIPTYPGMSDLYNDNNKGYFIGYKMYLEEHIYPKYKFKGYINMLNNSVKINELEGEIDRYVYETFTFLRRKIAEINKTQQDYYDFKRPFVLIINKL